MNETEYEEVISNYYGDGMVRSMIGVKVETNRVDEIAEKIGEFPEVVDLFLVTGDVDILIKVVFKNYASFRNFVTHLVPQIDGIKETQTFMVVTVYKEGGQKASFE